MDTNTSFYNAIKHAHSGWRWVVLFLLLYAIYNAFRKKASGNYSESDRKINLFAMIVTHVQLLLGLILYFSNQEILDAWGNLGNVMKVAPARHMVVEHLVGMIISIVFITIGHSKSKRASNNNSKHRKIWVFYLLGLIIILATIPWLFRFPSAAWF